MLKITTLGHSNLIKCLFSCDDIQVIDTDVVIVIITEDFIKTLTCLFQKLSFHYAFIPSFS